jgi:adenine-specific DNA methylase
VKCPFCDREFDEKAAEKACGACAVFGGCKMVKCPHCGYESPREPGLVKWLKRLGAKSHDKA